MSSSTSQNNHFAFSRKNNNKKRKASSLSTTSTTPTLVELAQEKKQKKSKRNESVSNLGWKSIALPSEFGFDEDGGLLEIDEVEGVDVVYADGGVKFQVNEEPESSAKANPKKKPKKSNKEERQVPVAQVLDESPFPDEQVQQLLVKEPVATANTTIKSIKKDKKGKGKANAITHEVPQEDEPIDREFRDSTENCEPSEELQPDAGSRYLPAKVVLPHWSHLPLAPPLYCALAELGFNKPTDVQERALSVEIGATPFVESSDANEDDHDDQQEEEEWGGILDENENENEEDSSIPYVSPFLDEAPASTEPISTERDIVGVAQTGSGKTLAYGLPILSYILKNPPSSTDDGEDHSRLRALILAPTRELAIQVRAAISEVAIRTNKMLADELQDPNPNAPRKRVRGQHISVVALTGGMSVEKQKRQLARGADILVATPGRLWDLIGETDSLARAIKGIKFLVIDEADRMIETGHFAELENIVRLTRRKKPDLEDEEDEFIDDFPTAISSTHSRTDLLSARQEMRTFVFSATMSKDLQQNLKKRHRKFRPGRPQDGMSSLDDLLLKLDFRDPDPEIIDLTPEHGLVETLKECKIECMLPDKDVHLYHFLLRYPARTIVFLASIDGIRRLHPLLTLLGLNVVQLHSGMQQRARLKALDRFKSSSNTVLLATDVAARGLDIPAVSHVVHFQLPRTADVYVHRSGRTARAGKEGLALQLVAPEEKQVQKLLMASLGKGTDLPELPVDYSIFDKLKQRIELAKKIEGAQHKATKQAHDDNWLRQAAESMELEIPSDFEFSDDDGGENGKSKGGKKKLKGKEKQLQSLKDDLKKMLSTPLMMRGVSAKYLTTRATVGLVDQLVAGTGHDKILGFEKATALEDLSAKKQKKK